MRTLSSALTTTQAKMGTPYCRIVLTSGVTTYTYSFTSANVLLGVNHIEQPYNQQATVVIDNYDGTLTSLDPKGYQGVISYGYRTGAIVAEPNGDGAGNEFSYVAPLTVVSQQLLSRWGKTGQLTCQLGLIGVPNLLALDKASANYSPTSADTNTVKDLIDAICGDTTRGITFLACFNHCTAYTVDWDGEDALIDVFLPKDAYRIYKNGSRLDALKRLLDFTECVMRVGNDGHIHIFIPTPYALDWVGNTIYVVGDKVKPTTENGFEYICTDAGTSATTPEPTWPITESSTVVDGGVIWTIVWYDSEYSLVKGEHNFFAKVYRKKLVIPGYIQVDSRASDGDGFTGNAYDSDTPIALRKREYIELRVTGNPQAASIAAARLRHYQLDSEAGAGSVPMNVGQEVYDYVKITDSRENDSRIGSIGQITRTYAPKKFAMDFRFGGIEIGMNLGGIFSTSDVGVAKQTVDVGVLNSELNQIYSYIERTLALISDLQNLYSAITFIIDGGGAVITIGQKGHIQIPFAGEIIYAVLLADVSGSIIIDIWKDTMANFPPADADSITATAPPTLTSEQGMIDTTLTGWTRTFASGSIFAFNVDPTPATITRVTLTLVVRRS